MKRYLAASNILRSGKRALAVVLLGLLLGTLAAPAASSAATRPPLHRHGVVLSADGVGDSPVVP
jgi:hypothetical protein